MFGLIFRVFTVFLALYKLYSPTFFLTFDGEPAGDVILDFAGDVTGVFLGDPLGEVVVGSSSFRREGGGTSVHDGALGPPTAPYAPDP